MRCPLLSKMLYSVANFTMLENKIIPFVCQFLALCTEEKGLRYVEAKAKDTANGLQPQSLILQVARLSEAHCQKCRAHKAAVSLPLPIRPILLILSCVRTKGRCHNRNWIKAQSKIDCLQFGGVIACPVTAFGQFKSRRFKVLPPGCPFLRLWLTRANLGKLNGCLLSIYGRHRHLQLKLKLLLFVLL